MPEGDPDGLRDAARRWGAAGNALLACAGDLRAMPAMLGSWQGPASASYAGSCLSQGEALTAQGEGWIRAGGAALVFATELEDAQTEARAAIAQAKEAKGRLKKARTELAAAKERLDGADQRAAGATDPVSHSAAQRDADEAAGDIRYWQGEEADAKSDLKRARLRGERAERKAREAARTAATVFAGVQADMPTLMAAPPPPATGGGGQEDRPWWKDAPGWIADRVQGVGKGALEGFEGMGEGLLMLVRLQDAYRTIDPEGYQRQADELEAGAKFAWKHPDEFGKALIDYEDLAGGRYDEWIGNFAPDALAAIVTGGGSAALRGLKGADAAADLAKDTERLGEGGRGARIAEGAGAPGLGDSSASVSELSRAFRESAATGTGPLTRNLERDLGIPKPPNSETHHLVPKGEYANRKAREQLEEVQAQLQRFGIGPDDASNGAFMPKADHRAIHTNSYFRALNRELRDASSEEEARDILTKIRQEVIDGTFPR